MEYVPIEKKGLGELTDTQKLPSPSSGYVHPSNGKSHKGSRKPAWINK